MAVIEICVTDEVLENLKVDATDKGFLFEDYLMSLWAVSLELADLVTSRHGSASLIGEVDGVPSERPRLTLINGGKQF